MFLSRSEWGFTSKSAHSPWASVAASSRTLPMVDGGWGGLQDPNTIWIGHHLGFRAFGLAAGSDRGSSGVERENHVYASLRNLVQLPERKGNDHALKLDSRTQGHVGSAAIEFERSFMARSRWKLDTVISHAHRSTGADRASEHSARPPALKAK